MAESRQVFAPSFTLFNSQVYKAGYNFGVDGNWSINDFSLLPLALSGSFLCFQILRIIFFKLFGRKNAEEGHERSLELGITQTRTLTDKLKDHVKYFGGFVIFGFMLARLAGSFILLYLSILTPMRDCNVSPDWLNVAMRPFCVNFSMTLAFAYTTVMAFIAVTSRTWSKSSARYNILVLLSALGVYAYRDLWPLGTYSLEPMDKKQGKILWVKIGVLFVTAVIIPLFVPHRYIPIDPENPVPVPNPEQTASWFSAITFTFVDPVILLAGRVAHLGFDQLPPLADYDHANYFCKVSMRYLDTFSGANRRHVFFGFLRVFCREYMIIAFSLVLASVASFIAPTAINRTLYYLETGGGDSPIKPWVWIILLFIGPMSQSLCEHWYLFYVTIIRVRMEGLITQLVFNHGLRIRLKAETVNGSESTYLTPTPSEADTDSSYVSSEVGHGSPSDNESESTQASTAVNSESNQGTLKGTVKGKSKTDEGAGVPAPPEKKSSGDAENLIGRINNLVTTDLNNMVDGIDFLEFVLVVPLQITLSMVFLTQILGWSALIGLIATIIISPMQGYIAKVLQDIQAVRMKLTDARVQSISESIGVLRMIKLFGWEGKMAKHLQIKRDAELKSLLKVKIVRLANMVFSLFIPTISMLATYATYTVIMKQELTASKIFSSMAVFSILQSQLQRIAWQTGYIIEGKVSIDRLNQFLKKTELLDRFYDPDPAVEELRLAQDIQTSNESKIGFRNASFAWSVEDNDGMLTPSSRKFRLHIEGELLFKRNCINLIIGPTGSGKTSILMALLGEMHFIPSNADTWFGLPRRGGVAYASQESWVQNKTIRDNILFGSPYDEVRYAKVIRHCALERDLELFEAGDMTEVGERGLTLSGGQKARVTLARAIYSSAEIILLDDVLAALDVHTSTWIINYCFRGDLVKGRTVLLVTHNVALAGPVAGFVVSLGLDGSVRTQGTEVEAALAKNAALVSEIAHEKEQTKVAEEGEAKTAADGKLVIAEEIAQGHITWKSMKLLLSALGGNHPILFTSIWILGMIIVELVLTLRMWFLGVWGSQYEKHLPSEVKLPYYLITLTWISFAHIAIFFCLNLYYFAYRTISASTIIHEKLINSVFGSTFRWLDETPTGRIIVRCTQDIRAIDIAIPQSLYWALSQLIGLIMKLGVIVMFTPTFLIPGLFVAFVGALLGNMYLKAQLSIKREMSNARSPLLAHFSAAIHGLVSIRAFGAQSAFVDESYARIDHYSRIARTSWNANRWIGIRIDTAGSTFTTLLAFYLVYRQNIGAGNTGFSLNMAISFCDYIFLLIRIFNQFEVESNSLERIQDYIDIEHEPEPKPGGVPPAAWPTSGDLRVENLSARYSQTGPKVLHDLSFHVKSGQRIGIVGRTGSGKSSLTLAFLRCILTEGTIYYDGIATNTINLDALRSSITIIPQTPELLSGSLRENLDPFGQNDDATLNNALRAAGLFSLQEDAGEARLSLDSKMAGGGGNLSVGQRQIIALARAMVRGSKLLILDEATSAIDYKTDAVIQRTLRSELPSDVTVITVAHRLQTIMDADKIMVLDSGKIVEFDSPKNLLKIEDGYLRSLVEGSGDKPTLVELAASN